LKYKNYREINSSLEQVQESIKKDILTSFSLASDQKIFLSKHKKDKLIVRSSSNEDTEECVNAGGNQSLGGVEASEEELKKAIAQVVASYFSYQSIKNRLINEDKETLLSMPLCSILLMQQITEDSEEDLITSGVMMTHQNAWSPLSEERVIQISATLGFGEGVVKGAVPCDEWIITEDLTYQAIRKKPFRLIASPGQKSKEVANPPSIQEKPVLSDLQLQALQNYALRIESGFQMPMDIEFVIKLTFLSRKNNFGFSKQID
jgi:phosphoenolpyruvate synthase/pyruvate phosphate dikinase